MSISNQYYFYQLQHSTWHKDDSISFKTNEELPD